MSEQKQAFQITIWLENGQLKVNMTGNMGPAQAVAGMEIAKFKLLSDAVINRRDPMIQVPGMLRSDLKRVPS